MIFVYVCNMYVWVHNVGMVFMDLMSIHKYL